jgi:hypothetical protein
LDFERVLGEVSDFLEREHLPFALVGGLALQAYGLSRATFDVDLVVAVDAQTRVIEFIESLGFETVHRSEGFSNHVHREPSFGRIDFIYVDATTSQQLLTPPLGRWSLGGRGLPVPRPEFLIAMKVHAMRNDPRRTFKELADIQHLMRLPGIDENEVRGYFERAGLGARFDELKKAQ